MKLELLQTKQNGAKEFSRGGKSAFEFHEASETHRCCPDTYLVTFPGHLNKMSIFFYLHGICYIKRYGSKTVNGQVKRDLKF